MLINRKILVAAAVITMTSTAAIAERYNPYSAEDPGYAEALGNWGKEVLFAKYASKLCDELKMSYREEFFKDGPPQLWDNVRFDKFMGDIMRVTKLRMDNLYFKMGHQKFCKTTMEFITAKYKPDNRPVFIDGK